jgi:hypothetical protein
MSKNRLLKQLNTLLFKLKQIFSSVKETNIMLFGKFYSELLFHNNIYIYIYFINIYLLFMYSLSYILYTKKKIWTNRKKIP